MLGKKKYNSSMLDVGYQEYVQLKVALHTKGLICTCAHNSPVYIFGIGNDLSHWIIDSGSFDHVANNCSLSPLCLL